MKDVIAKMRSTLEDIRVLREELKRCRKDYCLIHVGNQYIDVAEDDFEMYKKSLYGAIYSNINAFNSMLDDLESDVKGRKKGRL